MFRYRPSREAEEVTAADDHGRRLSALDGSFLRLESAQAHMHVGFSAIYASPDEGAERPGIEALRARTAARLDEVPWCRWRLEEAPLGLSEPRWVDDPDFDVSAHVVELTEPGDRVSLATFASLRSTVLSAPLDRSRPLWQIFLVPCLEDGRIGMIGKIHHSLVDGIAALQVVGLIVDRDDEEPAGPASWQPARRSRVAGRALAAIADAAGAGLGAARAGALAATRPVDTVRRTAQGLGQLALATRNDMLPSAPPSALNVPIGSRRTLVGYHAARSDLRAARSAAGGTLNDVGLAVVAGALRELELQAGGRPDAPMKAMVPVSMRRAGESGSGNRIAMVHIRLPVHRVTPRERMECVREQTRQLKATDRPEGTQMLYRTAALLPPPLRTPAVRTMSTPRVFNVTVSQSPGPRGALHLMGCELEEVYSVVPIAAGHSLAIGLVRYRQELFFGCYADPDALPAVHDLPRLLDAELRALGEAEPEARASYREDGGSAEDGAASEAREESATAGASSAAKAGAP
jgi:diacylglycerol O-acyltransferase